VSTSALRAFFEQEFKTVAVSSLAVSWFLFDVAEIHRRRLYGSVKRVLETAASLLLVLIIAPAFPLIMLSIKLYSPGPVCVNCPAAIYPVITDNGRRIP
jgi:lipopolysaccharide/colanic/teichoic acid biosynthesis glycosyltransferase